MIPCTAKIEDSTYRLARKVNGTRRILFFFYIILFNACLLMQILRDVPFVFQVQRMVLNVQQVHVAIVQLIQLVYFN